MRNSGKKCMLTLPTGVSGHAINPFHFNGLVQMMVTPDSIRIPRTHAREKGDATLPKKRGLKRHYSTRLGG